MTFLFFKPREDPLTDGKAGQPGLFWPAPHFGPQSAGRVGPPRSLISGSLFRPAPRVGQWVCGLAQICDERNILFCVEQNKNFFIFCIIIYIHFLPK